MLTVSALAGVLLMAPGAFALPSRGQPLPEFSARDLTSGQHASDELNGRPTLLVVITDKDAGDRMRGWFDAADAHVADSVHRQSLITLKLPFFVSEGAARGKAKNQVPQAFWKDTWMDKNGGMAKALGLSPSDTPYVLALDAQGRVVASVHATVDSPEARAIWSALRR
ncbi:MULTISPECIES: hypothetical protein [unclassified Corallococcus]|uniref:hypothetical protein n=1 Tax=unclassified Corallococcus TaxID=2685029 RepID=UPI001A904C6A|nr:MULTISPECIES: hypothetical protein [unclassified Corallococcus]MBN9687250.1 hypothetical protein [Corallococcus sp. NCSPR001]WAS88922.1 hypothetical protein O0N60_18565 [Corallococcus sp. NCRR]